MRRVVLLLLLLLLMLLPRPAPELRVAEAAARFEP